MEHGSWGLLSLMPLGVTLLLAFATRSAIVSMLIGVFVGTVMVGALPGVGLNQLFQSSLGNADFIWVCEIVMLIGILLFSLLLALGWIPDFGPMRTAERRARNKGQLLRPGARPLREIHDLDQVIEEVHLGLELAVPILLILVIATLGLVARDTVYIVEAFGAAVLWMFLTALLRRRVNSAAEVAEIIEQGVKDVVPALLVVALAYALNAVAGQLGAGQAIVGLFAGGLSPDLLVPMTFLVTASIAFATGTSWGAFAIMMPVSLPAAYALGNGEVTSLALQTIGAIAGGGIFGDNASPVSDTTMLASVGAGSDHMDHVITQLPYALTVAVFVLLFYVLV